MNGDVVNAAKRDVPELTLKNAASDHQLVMVDAKPIAEIDHHRVHRQQAAADQSDQLPG